MNPAEILRKAAAGKRVAITPNQVTLATNGGTLTGSNGGMTWMGPNAPIDAQQQEVAGRAWDFPVGLNLQYTPRGTEAITFNQLRSLADNFDLVRLCIETRKDQLVKIKWNVQPIDPKQKSDGDSRIKLIEDFLKMPDRRNLWQPWLRALVEDLLVIDAATVYPRMNRGGGLYSLELLDGATIKRVIDDFGRQPLPPQPAFQQILKGVPAVDYTSDELMYVPRNLRTHKLYGFSVVEQIVMTVNIGLRRQLSQLQYYTNGSTPDLIFTAPASWTMDQIKVYQAWWDTTLAGDTAARRGAKVIPNGIEPYNTKEQTLKDEYDEWIARVVCYAFSLPPSAFVKQMNRATAGTAQEAALQEGLIPLMQWVKDLMDIVIWKYFGFTDLSFNWQQESEQDPAEQSAVLDQKLRNGSISINEARTISGMDPIPGLDKPMVYTGMGATPVDQLMADPPPEPDPQPNAEGDEQPPEPGDEKQSNDPQPGPKDPKNTDAKVKKKPAVAKAATDEQASATQQEKLLAIQKKLQQELADFLEDQSTDIAAQVAAGLEGGTLAEILDRLDFSGWTKLVEAVSEAIQSAAKDSGESALLQIGEDTSDDAFHVVNQAAADYAQDRSAEMVGMKYVDGDLVQNPDAQWQITDSTREMIRGTVTQAQEEGWSSQQVADALQDNYAFSDSRAEMIARTEIAKAATQGSIAGWKASGVVSNKQWLTAPDCCDECSALDGVIVGIDEEFPDGGGDGAPLHPRCECSVLPVVDAQTDEE